MNRAHLLQARLPLGLAAAALTATGALAQGPLPPPPVPSQNPITAEKAVLGKILFWDEQLSSDGSIACGTCHIPSAGGGDPRIGTGGPSHPGPDGNFGTPDDIFGSVGVVRSDVDGDFTPDSTFGHDLQATGRNSPSMIAAAYFDDLFWDGRATSNFVDPLTGNTIIPNGGALESQSLGPIQSDVEMAWEGRGWDAVIERLESVRPLALATNLPSDTASAIASNPTYGALFQDAFGTADITPVRIAFALATYQRTLIPDQSKFDEVMRGNAQFTQLEAQGRNAFNSPGSRCDSCHGGSLFSDGTFRNLGLRPIAEDDGRRSVTGNNGDRGRFKTPSLRNVSLRERFFHTGAPGINDLNGVLVFYDQDGGPFNDNKDPLLNNLNVPPQVRPAIVAFLETLTDPRVAAELPPFDRPTLRSERGTPNPQPLGVGAETGSGLLTPEVIAVDFACEENDHFRLGVHNALGGALATVVFRPITPAAPGASGSMTPLPLIVTQLEGVGIGAGYGTWTTPAATDPSVMGLAYAAQWAIRDPFATGGTARTEWVRIEIE